MSILAAAQPPEGWLRPLASQENGPSTSLPRFLPPWPLRRPWVYGCRHTLFVIALALRPQSARAEMRTRRGDGPGQVLRLREARRPGIGFLYKKISAMYRLLQSAPWPRYTEGAQGYRDGGSRARMMAGRRGTGREPSAVQRKGSRDAAGWEGPGHGPVETSQQALWRKGGRSEEAEGHRFYEMIPRPETRGACR